MRWMGRGTPIDIESIRFLKSAASRREYDGLTLPQIALAGRSNVGKSSLINALAGREKPAKISSVPGKTRLINFYLINEKLILTDLPGYGYARVSWEERRKWGPMIEEYLLFAPCLRHIFLVLDIRRDPTDDDRQMAWWAQHYAVPVTIIATKADRIVRSQRRIRADGLSDALGMTFRTPTIVFSARDGTGRQEILERLEEITT